MHRLIQVAPNAHGFYLDGQFATVINTTVSTDTNSYDFITINDGKITSINCSIKKIQVTEDGGGVLKIKNYLGVQVYNVDGVTPLSDADMEINDNSESIYASLGYGGTKPTTDVRGRILNIIVTDRWYSYSNTATENTTNVKVKKIEGLNWEEVRLDVDMSISHTESFIVYENYEPPIPMGLEINRVAGINSLNISWDSNLNTINYAVYTNKSGQWDFLINVTHPQTWTLDEDLEDETWYYYRIKAWGNLGISSELSSVVSYYLIDITPPAVPLSINVSPVPYGDALNISWDLNLDDTVNYEIWWEEPDTGYWVQLSNVSYLNNYFIFTNESLINGSTYYFKIKAWDKVSLSSAFSPFVDCVHRDYLAPEAPSSLIAKSVSKTIIGLSWGASRDLDVEGYLVYINQSGSSSGGPYKLQAMVNLLSYKFNNLIEDTTYYFTISAFDEANNPSPFSALAWNTTFASPKRPRVILTVPANNSINVSIDSPVTILFNISMDTTSVERVLSMSPSVEYEPHWTENDTLLRIDFMDNLSYNTWYNITIYDAKATTGGVLEDSLYVLSFKTKKETIIIINTPLANTEIKPGEIIKVTGSSTGFDDGTKVTVILDNIMETSKIGIDGSWSVTIKAPDIEGNYIITVMVDSKNDSISIIVKDTEKIEDDAAGDDKEDLGIFGMGLIIDLVIIILIVIIIIIIFLVIINILKKN